MDMDDFSVDHNICDVSDILSIYKYLIKKQNMKQCFLTEQNLNCLEKNNNIFQTTHFNHTMTFFKITD